MPAPHYWGSDVYRLEALSDDNAMLLTSQFSSLKFDLIGPQGQLLTPDANTVFSQYVSNANLAFTRSGDTVFLAASVSQNSGGPESLLLQKIVPAGSSASDPASVPPLFELGGIRPNPFRDETKFSLQTAKAGQLEISVYNLRGQKARTIHSGMVAAGKTDYAWDGRDDRDRLVSSGVYLLQARSDGKLSQIKLLKLK